MFDASAFCAGRRSRHQSAARSLLAAVTLADQAGASLGAGPMPVALAHR